MQENKKLYKPPKLEDFGVKHSSIINALVICELGESDNIACADGTAADGVGDNFGCGYGTTAGAGASAGCGSGGNPTGNFAES